MNAADTERQVQVLYADFIVRAQKGDAKKKAREAKKRKTQVLVVSRLAGQGKTEPR